MSYSSSSSEENESEDIEKDTIVCDISENYAPSGVESDHNSGKCCHWSKQRDSVPDAIKAVPGAPEQGKPSQRFPDNYKPDDLVEAVLDDVYLDMCITATNEHAAKDTEFQKRIGRIETNEKGRRAFLKGYFEIDWHLSLLGGTKLSELLDKSSLEYHPLQNILKGTEHLRQKSNTLWTSGEKMCI